jgi:dolichol kinase
MVTAFAQDSRDLALELHRLLGELDRSRFRWRESVRALPPRLSAVQGALRELVRRDDAVVESADPETSRTLRERLVELERALSQYAPKTELRADWLAFRARVVPTYEALATSLREAAIHVPSLRPKNYARNAFHVFNAALSLTLLHLLPSWDTLIVIAWVCAAIGWSMELSRKVSPRANELLMKLFAPVAHPHEAHRVNSATYYVTSIAILASTRELVPAALALVTLGLGDPVAAIIGRRWGRVRWVNGRSVEGTLAFVLTAALGGVLLLTLAHGMALAPALALAGAAALLGALAELYSRKIDDNLAVPVMAWTGAFLVGLVIGG